MKVLPLVSRVAVSLFVFVAFASSAAHAGTSAIPRCTHAQLHAGSCVEAQAGRLARIRGAVASETDRCEAAAVAGGDEPVLCRFDGQGWREFSRRHLAAAPAQPGLASAEFPLVLDIMNPPAESGLVPPVADGLDGLPLLDRTDDAPAINAAIQYACDNGYDIAYLGPGGYRIGAAGTGASFYSGIRIDAKRCPGGIRFLGAGAGRTVLLANGQAGQYIVFTTDEFSDTTRVFRSGWNTSSNSGVPDVTHITTGVVPPVVTGDGDPHLVDGDSIHVRNCGGTVQANDRTFRVGGCTNEEPFSCELYDEEMNPIDATYWAPFDTESACVINKLNRDFEVEIAYMTLRDDDPDAHSTTVCDPTCNPAQEESHGIGILQGGGFVEVHDVIIDRVGDEAIDISAPESPTWVHDVTILNPELGGTPVYQGVGVRIEDVLIHKSQTIPGETNLVSYGVAIAVDPGSQPARVVDLTISRVVMTGLFRQGVEIKTNTTGKDGQMVSGVRLLDSAIDLQPFSYICNASQITCSSVRLQSRLIAFPMDDIEIRNNFMTGTAMLELANGEGGVVVRDNTITPITTAGHEWGLLAGAKRTRIEGNLIEGFARGCIHYQPYETHGGSNSAVTTEIVGNTLRCRSNVFTEDPMIGVSGALTPPPAPDDEVYFRINDNMITATSNDYVRYGVNLPHPLSNVEICRNTIALDPNIPVSGSIGVWSQSEGQLICDNQITLGGAGVRVDAAGSRIVGNRINGFDTTFSYGILASDSNDLLILRNELDGYRQISSSGIRIESEESSVEGVRIIANRLGSAGRGILFDSDGSGIDDVSIASNEVDAAGLGGVIGVLLEDTTNAHLIHNEITGLTATGASALLTTGSTDFIRVRGNVAQGGGGFRFGASGGDASCEATGVGENSICSDNELQP